MSQAPTTGLDAALHVVRPQHVLDVDLTAAPGEVVVLLGPNAAGKTTALRALAGLQPLTAGHVLLDGRPLQDLPPERRRVGVVPQDGLLLPHLSARDNVAYGLRARGARRQEARARADAELAAVGLAEAAHQQPRTLSGGQAQRVALARALVTEPALLLLDEPLAALDAVTRTQVRADLRERLTGFGGPTLLVTHDLVDALVLGTRLVVLEDGQVVQQGSPEEVARRPRTPYVAGLVGLVLLDGEGRGDHVAVGDQRLPVPAQGPVHLAFPPTAVVLGDEPGGWPVEVTAMEQQGSSTRVGLTRGLTAALDATTLARLDLRPGRQVRAHVDPQAVEVYPRSSIPRSRRSLAT